MASIMTLGDFLRLLPFFGLDTQCGLPSVETGGELSIRGTCTACGMDFDIELLTHDGELLFNYEDFLCPMECNRARVYAADFHEQCQYERLEEFFAPACEERLPTGPATFLHLLAVALDN
jgi:RecJ-like exonuclease